jgi:hypothetical protein
VLAISSSSHADVLQFSQIANWFSSIWHLQYSTAL